MVIRCIDPFSDIRSSENLYSFDLSFELLILLLLSEADCCPKPKIRFSDKSPRRFGQQFISDNSLRFLRDTDSDNSLVGQESGYHVKFPPQQVSETAQHQPWGNRTYISDRVISALVIVLHILVTCQVQQRSRDIVKCGLFWHKQIVHGLNLSWKLWRWHKELYKRLTAETC